MFGGGGYVTSHIRYGRKFLTLDKYKLFFNIVDVFKAVRVPWVQSRQYLHSWVDLLQMVSELIPTPCGGLFGTIGGVFSFGLIIP